MRSCTLLKWGLPLALVIAGLAVVRPVYAHGFGPRYDLPVPLWLYITGAGAAVALSFLVIGVFVKGTPGLHGYPRKNLLKWAPTRFLAKDENIAVVKLLALALFVLTIITGLFGDQRPLWNLTPTMVWVLWWVGVAFISAFLGNIWALINPWKTIFAWTEKLYEKISQGKPLSRALPYPDKLAYWPAVGLFIAFAWIETVYPSSAEPRALAILMLIYSGVTLAGMYLFGKHAWLRHGEAFSILFGYLARFAPTEVRVNDRSFCQTCSASCLKQVNDCVNCYECWEKAPEEEREWNLRPFASGLLSQEKVRLSQTAFVLAMLATVSFDGFTATPIWGDILRKLFNWLSFVGDQALNGANTLGFLGFLAMFPLVFLPFTGLVAILGKLAVTPGQAARAFVYSLIPIALAYHLAHFFSFLIIQGQLIIPLASDPFGWGWDLFGTADYTVNIGIVNARMVWFVSIAAIVIGHIVAVYAAHVTALRSFKLPRLALQSQYPMMLLMVGYTMLSLWTLAQPIVEENL